MNSMSDTPPNEVNRLEITREEFDLLVNRVVELENSVRYIAHQLPTNAQKEEK